MGRVSETQRLASSDEVVSNVGVWVEVLDDELSLDLPCSSSCCERNWSTYFFIHSIKRNKMTPQCAEDLVFVHNNLRLLSRRSRQYIEGESKLWDVGGDAFDSLEGAGLLEIASLSLDEPDMEAVIFTEDEGEQVEPIDVEDS
ncbi:uncharacterized protein LOC114273439 [Camellia sinensis]|uniref:uncharacterized protein LOC114273439 n=1 Tax=Camellia sinensis TaxID=4442 RepID=UPI00103696EF|nr:uncharacterized protein LOC114273439 [Camellia sinensis]